MDREQHRTLLICSAVCLLMGETITMCAMLMQLLVLRSASSIRNDSKRTGTRLKNC